MTGSVCGEIPGQARDDGRREILRLRPAGSAQNDNGRDDDTG